MFLSTSNTWTPSGMPDIRTFTSRTEAELWLIANIRSTEALAKRAAVVLSYSPRPQRGKGQRKDGAQDAR
jgi:hypothetical protein